MTKDHITLSAQLTPEEMTCIEHCQQYSDCAADGECGLQERVVDIIAENAEKT